MNLEDITLTPAMIEALRFMGQIFSSWYTAEEVGCAPATLRALWRRGLLERYAMGPGPINYRIRGMGIAWLRDVAGLTDLDEKQKGL